MQKGSIAARLFWLSAIWLIVALIATGLLLADLYSRALDRSQIETLNFNLETLVARTLETGAPDSEGIQAADPRYNRSTSGWYWQISTLDGDLQNLSNSLVASQIPQLTEPFDTKNRRTGIHSDDFGTRLRIIERKVTILGTQYVFAVTGNIDDIENLTGQFRNQTFIVLGAVGIMLAIMSALVARVALRPVGMLANAIEKVRSGEAQNIEGDYPRELTPLADELNELLRSNTEIVARAKSQVGNLAHGLKTPLAVLRNEVAGKDEKLAKVVRMEVEKMNGQVKTYLDRAQLSARSSVVGSRSDVNVVVPRLVRVMQKLHKERECFLTMDEDSALFFRGEESDLEEMVGNLLDNACKWSNKKVMITISRGNEVNSKIIIIHIEDDGIGLSQAEAHTVMRRGVRLDEKTAGSGLGLDIVKELVDIYGGKLDLGVSDMGGLSVSLTLPATT